MAPPPGRARGPETCNGVDDDGDGQVDEAPVAWARDADGDGLGDPAEAFDRCGRPDDAVANDADCDDATRDLPAVFYVDEDADGVGGDVFGVGCDGPARLGGDCDDNDPSIVDCEPTDTGTAPTTGPTTPGAEPAFGFGLGCASAPSAMGLLAMGLVALGTRRRG